MHPIYDWKAFEHHLEDFIGQIFVVADCSIVAGHKYVAADRGYVAIAEKNLRFLSMLRSNVADGP